MSLHAPPQPGEGLPPLWFLLDAKKFRFEYKEGQDGPYKGADHAHGILSRVWLKWFAGTSAAAKAEDSVSPRYELNILLSSEPRDILIKISSKVPYYTSAGKLLKVAAGEEIFIKPIEGGNTTLLDISRHDGTKWQQIMGGKNAADDPDENVLIATRTYFAHPAYDEREEEAGPDGGVKAWRSLAGTPAPANQPAGLNAPHAGNAQQQPPANWGTAQNEPAGNGQAVTAAPASEAANPAPENKPSATVPEGTAAWGYTPTMWPVAEFWNVPATPTQESTYRLRAIDRGVKEGDLNATARAILTRFNVQLPVVGAPFSKAAMQLVLAFIVQSDAEAMKAAVAAGADEFDPFADE